MRRWYLAPRWFAFHASVVLVVLACVLLGLWQLDRAREQHTQSLAPVINASRTAVSIDDVLLPGTLMQADAVGRRVVIDGTYDEAAQVVVPNRTVDGTTGAVILTPFVTDRGDAVVVDRGLLPDQPGRDPIPPAPNGRVTVTGWLAPSEDPPSVTADLPVGQIGSIHLPSLANQIPHPLYDGYVLLGSTGNGLLAEPPPTQVAGGSWPLQNLFYAIEWWFFGLAVVIFWIATLRRGPSRADRSDRLGGGRVAGGEADP